MTAWIKNGLTVDGRWTASLSQRRQLAVYSRCVEPQPQRLGWHWSIRQSIWCDDAVKMQRSTRIADRWTSTLSTATAAAANWPGSPRRPGSVRCSELPICPVIHTLSSDRHSPTSSTNSTRKTSQISNFSKTASTDAKSEITNCLLYNCCNYSYLV